MISHLQIENFKGFERLDVEFSPLTILCGANGTGKSSVIQSIILAREAAIRCRPSGVVPLSGLLNIDLGIVQDLVCQSHPETEIHFSLRSATEAFDVTFESSEAFLENAFLTTKTSGEFKTLFQFDHGLSFSYLSPDRFGPRHVQTRQGLPRQDLKMGSKGEFVAEIITAFERTEISAPAVLHPNAVDPSQRLLRQQLELWLAEITNSVQIRPESFPSVGLDSLRVKRPDVRSEWVKLTHTGFGISHCLPILVAGLLTPSGGLLVVDSPESHLHPRAQSTIGQFLGRVACGGVQVIIETHSDHILNGIRLAVASPDNPLQSAQVAIYHFGESLHADRLEKITVQHNGELSSWPMGFFDQIERDLGKLSGLRIK